MANSLLSDVCVKSYNGWNLNFSDHKEIFNGKCIAEASNLLDYWSSVFPYENSWIQNTYKVPSLIVRLDCIRNESGYLELFEIEERPAGIGFASELSPAFKKNLGNMKKQWPKIHTLISSERRDHDDTLWAERISFEKACENGALLIIRAEPEEKKFHSLISKSVSTLLMKGSKSYGVKMGLWQSVSMEDFENLPWEKGFCLKPIQSSKCRDIEIWHPELRKNKKNGFAVGGTSTRTQIQRTLAKNGTMYLQPFIMPMPCLAVEGGVMAFRVYFGFNPQKNSYDFIGGLWNARKNLRLHGASDTITGPIE